MKRATYIFFTAIIFLSIIFCLWRKSIQINDGKWIYPLDDTYIHLAVAKNLSQHGVWGITRHEFSSCSSSILYTLLLSFLVKTLGISVYLPLAINLLTGVVVFFVLYRVLISENINAVIGFMLSLGLLFFSPLPSLAISGMEHLMQILIDFLLVYTASLVIENEEQKRRNVFLYACILAVLSTMIRYEGIFLVMMICSILFIRRRIFPALILMMCGILPIILFGIYSMMHKSFFLPNSILLKGEKPTLTLIGILNYATGWLTRLIENPHLLVLFLWIIFSMVYLWKRNIFSWNRKTFFATIILGTFILHLTLAKTGWFFRYEAYLVFLGIVSSAWLAGEIFQNQKSISVLHKFIISFFLLIALYPLSVRAGKSLLMTVPATKNIYDQQYQMAMFLKKYYNTSEVAANDIGAICYFTDIKLLDIFGLASKEIISLRIRKEFDEPHIASLAANKNIKVAIIYESWFIGKVPKNWQRAGIWEVRDNVILGGDAISFFSTSSSQGNKIRNNLQKFSPFLPKDVIQKGEYVTFPNTGN